MTDRKPAFLGPTITRRTMLGTSVSATGLTLAGCASHTRRQTPESGIDAPDRPAMPPQETGPEDEYLFFTAEEARAVEAIVARIIPGDDADPGAAQAGVSFYIDHKLARFDAFAVPTYHQGPFAAAYEGDEEPDPTPDTVPIPAAELGRYGFQSELTPQEHYRLGLAGVDRYAQSRYGSLFADLDDGEQDELLMVLDDVQERDETNDDGASEEEMDEAETVFGEVDPGEFFNTVRIDTIEGMFSDPAYGGNRNLVGWTLIGWPGSQRSYSPHEMLHGTNKTPQSLEGLTPIQPDRVNGGKPALEQPETGVHNH